MSLKAKIEAVIYAAEEPVTLAQLGSLFAEEALEEKRARETVATAAGPANEVDVQISIEPPEPEEAETPEAVDSEPAALTEEPTEPSAEDEKKAARLREREVRDEIRRLLQELIADYANGDRGMEIREIAGGYRVGTKPEYHDAVRGFVKSLKPPMKLSLQALETLAVIAYKQPVTAPEVGEIRGVDSAGVIGSLISRKLITTAGRKQVIGRPILYKTSKEFLLRFGLKDIGELPSMEEFEKMAADELSEPGELPFEGQPVAQEVDGDELDAEAIEKAEAVVEIANVTGEDADIPGITVKLDHEGDEEPKEEINTAADAPEEQKL